MKKGRLKIVLIIILIVLLLPVVVLLSLNSVVVNGQASKIISPEEAYKMENADCILVLGCGVKDNGVPSDMLRDRLIRSVDLYKNNAAPKLLMSGDHGKTDYNEVGTMKNFAIDSGIDSEDIFMDHAGFSTYESIYRAKEIFGAEKIIIVSQEYHLYRALHIAESFGLEAFGVAADYHTYGGQAYREVREILARAKDFATSVFKPKPTYLGEFISIKGDGNLTNDY
ncbi:MAG: SanA protein [Ruminococcaceae bacterium]|nr:SanA protein [Oscillospiraceae bacterium]